LCILQHPNTRFEIISSFIFTPLQQSDKTLFLGKKEKLDGHLPQFATPPPDYAYENRQIKR
jgi:hypothetical protein